MEDKVTDLLKRSKEALAQYELGLIHFHGDDVPENHDEAEKWFKLSADQGNAFAQYQLGKLNYMRDDVTESMKWLKLSANQGNKQAQHYLGNIYYNDIKDYDLAIKYLKLSADQNYGNSQFVIGTIYYFGHGVQQDYNEAYKWFKKSIEQGCYVGQEFMDEFESDLKNIELREQS